jgi:hypothetical protein
MVSLSSIAGLHACVRCAALALAGIGYAVFQVRLKPSRGVLLKRLMLATAFLLWAFEQLLPAGRLTAFLGDAVIVAFVLDLIWVVQDQR